jgi:hypothetical protein
MRKSIPEALKDLEMMRLKFVGEGGNGSISELAEAIRSKNRYA